MPGQADPGVDALPESAQICSCFDVSKGDIAAGGRRAPPLAAIKQQTKAGTGCGGCVPLISQVLNAELAKQGIGSTTTSAPTSPLPSGAVPSGQGGGSKLRRGCWPNMARAIWLRGVQTDGRLHPRLLLERLCAGPEHHPVQDTNDIFLGNMQKDGTYSVIPRMAGGEVTPEGLLAVAEVARDYQALHQDHRRPAYRPVRGPEG